MPKPEPSFRWRGDILSVDGETIAGSVSQGASGDWFAYGMTGWFADFFHRKSKGARDGK